MANIYTFTCNTFVTSEPQVDPSKPPCAGCTSSIENESREAVETQTLDHLIVAHGYMDTPQLRTDIQSNIHL